MFTEPKLVLNKGLLLTHLTKVQKQKAELLASAGVEKEDLLSNPKFAELLRQFGVEPPMKRSPANPEKETYAFAKTDEEFKALLEHDDPRVQILTAARLGNKSTIEESRTQAQRYRIDGLESMELTSKTYHAPLSYEERLQLLRDLR